MTQKSIKRRGEKIVSTSSRQKTCGNEEICLMAIKGNETHLVGEGQLIVRPLLFVSDNYAYWKIRMRLFIQATNYEAWWVIFNGPRIPNKKVGKEKVIMEENEQDANDLKMAQLNNKTMHTLFCELGANKYTMVSLCENANEVWDKLQMTHERTNRVKKTKVGMLTHEYELFSMQPKELIFQIYNRFTTIITNLKGIGKTYANKELVKKILNSLPKSWEVKVIAIKKIPHISLG